MQAIEQNRTEQKEEEKKETQAIDAHMGEEEKKQGAGLQRRQLMHTWGKKKRTEQKNKRKKQGVDPQPSYLNHLLVAYDPHGSYGRNHPPQPIQLMRVWGKNNRTEQKEEERKKQGAGLQRRQLMHVWGKKNRTEQKEERKEAEQALNPGTWTIWSPLTTRMAHTVSRSLDG